MMEKEGRVIPVPVHGTADIGKGLLAEIELQTGAKPRLSIRGFPYRRSELAREKLRQLATVGSRPNGLSG